MPLSTPHPSLALHRKSYARSLVSHAPLHIHTRLTDLQVVGSSCRSLAVSTTHNTTLLQLLLPPRPRTSGPTAPGLAFHATRAQEGLPSADEMCGAVWRECEAAAANPAARCGACGDVVELFMRVW